MRRCGHDRHFDEHAFRRQVDQGLKTVRRVLENTRCPTYAADSDHAYDDKYALSEFLANSALAAQINVLERMGVDAEKLRKLKEMAATHSVTLRFQSKETCTFLAEMEVEQESSRQYVKETQRQGDSETTTHKVITKITEYHWSFGLEYELYAFSGNDPDDRVDLQSRTSSCEIVTTGHPGSPRPETTVPSPIDVPITWLLQNISSESVCSFKIDRSAKSCRTPRRNDEVVAGLRFFSAFSDWGTQLHNYFIRNLAGGVQQRARLFPSATPSPHSDLASVNTNDLFVPVLPLFEGQASADGAAAIEPAAGAEEPPSGSMVTIPEPAGATGDTVERRARSPLLSVGDINRFLSEQCNSLAAKHRVLTQSFPTAEGDKLISVAEAWLSLLALHVKQVADHFLDGVNYIESMLRSQLISAIGKELQPKDFADFVRFHEQKLFKPEYTPKPFCYAIRRPDHYPDGTLSIESQGDGNNPITTITRKVMSEAGTMHFPINAATNVEFKGDRYLHAWVAHEFDRGSGGRSMNGAVNLVARARQFSSFLLLVGKISGPSSFTPEHAIILQNKDELLLPLLLEQLPTPQEFKDAIESLSPEQKRFATAVRSMQLASSVFGVCVVQLKPQLEALLGLDDDTLTKEIKLTQDLLSLFIEYQIPSDLLTFDDREGNGEATPSGKVDAVKGHVAAVQEMLAAARAAEIAEEQEKARLEKERAAAAKAERERRQAEMEEMLARSRQAAQFDELCEMACESPEPMCEQPMAMARSSRSMAAPRMESAAMDMMGGPPMGGGGGGGGHKMRRAAPQAMMAASNAMPAARTSAPVAAPAPANDSPAVHGADAEGPHVDGEPVDLTQIPKQLDAQFEALDEDSSLRPTIIKTGMCLRVCAPCLSPF
eukprot:COSAG02_NODE_2599_length_8448_cov_229.846568_4_plen_887_part_00